MVFAYTQTRRQKNKKDNENFYNSCSIIAKGEKSRKCVNIKLFNNGEMIRDFTYIDDIVQGIGLIVDRALYNDGIKDVYNIGYGQQVHLMDFVKHIENNIGKKAITEMAPKHPADTKETWSDTTKLQALGYKPETPIEIGVRNFVEWYKNYYGVN